MSSAPESLPPPTPTRDPTAACSRAALVLALALLAATFFLISPPPGETYPGARPWSDFSILRGLIDLMSLNGLLASVRGVEVKDFAFHLAAAAGLALLGVRWIVAPLSRGGVRRGPVASAQTLLVGWVLLSLLSSLWAGDAGLARSQALLYALGVAWAVALAGTFDRRHLPAFLNGVVAITALGGLLCIWYYAERNPHHRPGFPIGNPLTLSTALLPGVLMAVAALTGVLAGRWREHRPGTRLFAAGAAIALVPLVACLALTQARGALVALATGLVTIGVFLVGRRWRWILASFFIVGMVGGALWWASTSQLDVAMARGSTVRFRFYAWRYASELWNASSLTRIIGQGAGDYPRLAAALAVRDRTLDPAAFMGEIVEHAHNEFFEVLSEIGLVGGVTYVGGFVATLFAAAAFLRSRRKGLEWWLTLGLVSSVVALLADALTGPALRLPGPPAVFFTLLGVLWAVCDAPADADRTSGVVAPSPRASRSSAWPALVCFAAALGSGWLAVRNWSGVQLEQAAHADYAAGRYADALASTSQAEPRLLDPVRVIAARRLALDAQFSLAREAFRPLAVHSTTAPTTNALETAGRLAEEAYAAALHLSVAVPALEQTDALAARAAMWLARLTADTQPGLAAEWESKAWSAWLRQRERTPFDVETLLALVRYAPLGERIALLRDALRFLNTLPFEESHRELRHYWQATLTHLVAQPGFDQQLQRFVDAAAPITPETHIDSIIASRAPETQRLAAACYGLRREYALAAERAARAAELYRPLRARFPALESIALAEEADYVLRAAAGNAPQAAELLQQALKALPVIQTHKYETLATPYRRQLGFTLLVAGRLDDGLQMLRLAPGLATDDAPELEVDLKKLLRDAHAAGLPQEQVQSVARALCPQFPVLCPP